MKYFLSVLISSSYFLVLFIFASHFFTTATFAVTSSNCVEIPKGTVPTNAQGGCDSDAIGNGMDCNSSAISCAEFIIKTLKPPTCPPANTARLAQYAHIESANFYCVSPTTIPTVIKNGFQTSVNGFKYLQCLGFVQTIAGATGHPIARPDGELYGLAVNVSSTTPAGYKPISTPQKGDIAIFSGHTAGHIAFVENVYPNSTVQLAEANGDGEGAVDYTTYKMTGDNGIGLTIVGYIRPV